MNSSPSLIKANGTWNGKGPTPGWHPFDFSAKPQTETSARTEVPQEFVGMQLSNGANHMNGSHTNGDHSNGDQKNGNHTQVSASTIAFPRKRTAVTWEPANISTLQPLPPVEHLFDLGQDDEDSVTSTPSAAPVISAVPVAPVREPLPDLSFLRQRVIDEAMADGQVQVEKLLQDAEQQANAIMAEAKANAAEVSRQAREDGLASAQAEAERLIRTSQTIVDEVHAWRESMLAQSEAAVLNLVTDIARTMFGNGLVLDPEVLRETFTRALSEAKQLGDLLVHLHPADISVLDRAWLDSQTASRAARVELVPDPSIRRGGCLVEGQFGQVDARVETKWGIVEQALTDTFSANAKVPEGAAA